MTSGVPTLLNQVLSQASIASAIGGNGVGLNYGDCLLSVPGSGLSLPIAAGHGSSLGPIEYAGGTVVVPNNTANTYVWLLRNQTITLTATTASPATGAIYLGQCATSGGNITSVDMSGVTYLIGGIAVRFTADQGMPGDSPSASTAFITDCPSGVWLWDGSRYSLLGGTIMPDKVSLVSGDRVFIPAGYSKEVIGPLSSPPGSVVVATGLLRVKS